MIWHATLLTGAAIAWLAYRGLIRALDLLAAGLMLAAIGLAAWEWCR